MDYNNLSNKSVSKLKQICRDKKIKRFFYSKKSRTYKYDFKK